MDSLKVSEWITPQNESGLLHNNAPDNTNVLHLQCKTIPLGSKLRSDKPSNIHVHVKRFEIRGVQSMTSCAK